MDRRALRLVLLGDFIGALILVAHFTGLTAHLTRERVHLLIHEAGAWGVVLYIVGFSICELLHFPSSVLVGAAVAAFGRAPGGALAFCAAIVSISVTFAFVRLVGGQPFADVHHPRLRTLLSHLDARPIRTVIVIRLLTWLIPSVNYALALSSVRYRDYLVGSALGLILPITAMATLIGFFF